MSVLVTTVTTPLLSTSWEALRRSGGSARKPERWYRQSLAIKEHLGNEHGQASTLHQLGRLAEERGNVAEAVQFYERAETLLARLNDPHSLGIVRGSLQRVRDGSHNRE
jgi:hypothetical protein